MLRVQKKNPNCQLQILFGNKNFIRAVKRHENINTSTNGQHSVFVNVFTATVFYSKSTCTVVGAGQIKRFRLRLENNAIKTPLKGMYNNKRAISLSSTTVAQKGKLDMQVCSLLRLLQLMYRYIGKITCGAATQLAIELRLLRFIFLILFSYS